MPFLLRAAIVGGAAYHVGKRARGVTEPASRYAMQAHQARRSG